MHLHDLTIQKSMFLNYFHDIFRYLLWHWFLMCFGINFVSRLAPFRHQCSFFWGSRFRYELCWHFYIFYVILRSKTEPLNLGRGDRGLRPPPKNHVSAPPSFKGCFFIDSAPLVHRFGAVVGSIWRWFRWILRYVFGCILYYNWWKFCIIARWRNRGLPRERYI